MQTPIIGQLLGNRYRVIETLAQGGFGQTYIAEDTHRPNYPKCVVKHLKPASDDSGFLSIARRLFATEAETLERLGSYDHIPRLLAYFEEDREFYLVQEWINGHPLTCEIQPGQRWTNYEVCLFLKEVLGILAFVHANQVIHRDVKPGNLIRREEDGKLFLVDFGAVKQIRAQVTGQNSAVATVAVGTSGYVPTEQLLGRPHFNSDIYALGITAIQALTGISSTQISTDPETEERVWRPFAVDVDEDLANLLDRMIKDRFRERYQTVEEVLQDLQPLLDRYIHKGATVRTTPPTIAPPDNPPTAPNPPTTHATPTPLELSRLTTAQPDSSVPQPPISISTPAIPATSFPIASQPPLSQPPLSQQPVQPAFPTTESGSRPVGMATSTIATEVTAPVSPPLIHPKQNRLPLLKIMGAVLALLGSGLGLFYYVEQQSYSQARQLLQQVQGLQAEEKYQECIEQAAILPQRYQDLYYTGHQVQQDCRLALAQQMADQGHLQDAITVVGQITADSAAYSQVQPLIKQWSERIQKIATDVLNQQGKLDDAVKLLQVIPASSPLYQQTQKQITQWQQEWQQYQTYWEAAQKAQTERKWQTVLDETNRLPKTPYWQRQAQPLIDRAKTELNKLVAPAPVSPSAGDSTDVQTVYESPTYPEPTYQAPIYQAPDYQEPSYTEPAYQPPYQEPAYQPPAEPPSSEPPPAASECPPGVQGPCV